MWRALRCDDPCGTGQGLLNCRACMNTRVMLTLRALTMADTDCLQAA